jgi:TetR/AcrR family transcriptional regulator
LQVFSTHGFRGATLDQIAAEAGLSKPNLLYYFDSKDAMHEANCWRGCWTSGWIPCAHDEPRRRAARPRSSPICSRKLELARDFPRESRLFANEILQGAPRLAPFIQGAARAGG